MTRDTNPIFDQIGELYRASRFDAADAMVEQILTAEASNPEAQHWRALVAMKKTRIDDAIKSARRAVELNGSVARYHGTLGLALLTRDSPGDADEASRALAWVVTRDPRDYRAYQRLGIAHYRCRRFAEAKDALEQSIRIEPSYAVAFNSLGNVLADMGRLDESIAAYERTVALRPTYDAAMINLADALNRKGERARATELAERATAIAPNNPASWSALGTILLSSNRLDAAIQACRRAVDLRPEFAEAHNHYASALARQGRIPEAMSAYETAIKLDPRSHQAQSNRLFTMHYDSRIAVDELRVAHETWGDSLQPEHLPARERRSSGRLRVGFVSSDFRDHPVSYFIEPILAHIDRERFELFCYSDAQRSDAVTQRLKGRSERWVETSTLSDEELADRVRSDEIDLLIDLAVHSARNRLLAFARKPAPVQATYLGYPSTTGLREMDWRITDSQLESSTRVGPEQSAILPRSYFCFRPDIEAPHVGALLAKQNDTVTFISANTLMKVSEQTIEAWARILIAVPRSRLILKTVGLDEKETQERVRKLFSPYSIDPARIELLGFSLPQEFFAVLRRADIALDSFPFNGGTTTCHLLWMGLPVVTLAGDRPVARMGKSILGNLGLHELVATNVDEYIAIAQKLASDVVRIEELRQGMRDRMRASALMDEPGFTRDLEALFLRMVGG